MYCNNKLNEDFIGLNKISNDEEFKPIKIRGKKLNYLISNYGRIYSFAVNRFLTNKNLDKDGYIKTSIKVNKNKRNYFQLHRLVAMHFCNIPRGNGFKVVFKDGNKRNVYYKNLIIIKLKSCNFSNKKYSDEKIENVCYLLSTTQMSLNRISRMTGVSIASVSKIYYRKQRKDISKKFVFNKRMKDIKYDYFNIDANKIYPDEKFKNIIIDGQRTHYAISNYGRVFNMKTKKMKKNVLKNNCRQYYTYIYSHKNKYTKPYSVAKLVIFHFNEEFNIHSKNLRVHYIDGNPNNLYCENLILKYTNQTVK